MSRIAIFIDGAYLDFILKNELGSPEIDYQALAQQIAGEYECLRTYYYNCLPYQGNPPTQEERTRFGRRQAFYSLLNSFKRFEVRLGRLVYRGTDPATGKRIFEQKRVDLMLGLDLVLLSLKHQISHAAILAGDSDFIPALEIAKNEGVIIHLYHGSKPHNELWESADERMLIDRKFIEPVRRRKD